jgi:hypothetical protein
MQTTEAALTAIQQCHEDIHAGVGLATLKGTGEPCDTETVMYGSEGG